MKGYSQRFKLTVTAPSMEKAKQMARARGLHVCMRDHKVLVKGKKYGITVRKKQM